MNKNGYAFLGIVALVVALAVGLGFAAHSSPTSVSDSSVGSQAASGGTYTNPVQFTKGLSLDVSNEIILAKRGTIAAGQNQGAWLNDTGRIVYVDYAELSTVSTVSPLTNSATASTSMRVSIGTSTAASNLAINFTQPYASLVDNALIATGTPNISINSDKDVGTNGRGTVPVLPGKYVYFLLRQDSTANCTGSVCENATSTNRGFNLFWYLTLHYQP